jgi:hypothetical protein
VEHLSDNVAGCFPDLQFDDVQCTDGVDGEQIKALAPSPRLPSDDQEMPPEQRGQQFHRVLEIPFTTKARDGAIHRVAVAVREMAGG